MNIPAQWAYLAVFIGVLGHASSEFFAVLSGVSGPEASVWRYGIGALGLVLWSLCRQDSRDLITPLRQEWTKLVPLSLVGVSATYLAFHWALDFASVIQVATLVTTIPIFVGLSNLILNGTPLSMVKILTGLFAIIGVALLLTDGYLDTLTEGSSLFGVILALVCAALGSFYAVAVKPMMQRQGGMRITTLALTIGAIGLWVTVGLFWGRWVSPAEIGAMPMLAAVSLLILGIWNTTITQLLWFGGLASAPDITRASYLFFLKPVIAALLAVIILGDQPTSLQILAIVVVTACVAIEIYWPKITGVAKS